MFYLYNLLLILIFPFFLVFIAFSTVVVKKWRYGFFTKFGFYSQFHNNDKNVIFHCVSVGETVSAVPLIKKFTEKHKNTVLSVTTKTGYEVAKRNLSNFVRLVTFFPYDFPFSVSRFFNAFNPKAIIIVETELWPNIIFMGKSIKIPVIFINGRISDRSFPNYLKFKWFFQSFLDVPYFLMQSERDKERILALGAQPAKVFVTGNIKYDLEKKGNRLNRSDFGIEKDDFVIIAGSTHKGEERIILDAFAKLRISFKKIKLIIVPRHPERFEEVCSLINQEGIKFGRRSRNEKMEDVLLVDTVGELFDFYGISDIAFVGGSLINIGGHNIIEPASYGIPVLFGPHMQNFKDISEEFVSQKAGYRVTEDSLAKVISEFICSEAKRKEAGIRAQDIVTKNRGSLNRTLQFIEMIAGG